jgi:hypothetical protein
MTANRNSIASQLSLDTDAAYANVGAATASPSNATTGRVTTAHGDRNAPNSPVTSRNATIVVSTRNSTKARCPATMSLTRSGDAPCAK